MQSGASGTANSSLGTDLPDSTLIANSKTNLGTWCERIEQAAGRIDSLVETTPVLPLDPQQPGPVRAFLKAEHLQKTGSFKLRGAANKILSLSAAEAARGVITSSTGNHGLGVAAAARHRGIAAEVVVCDQVSQEKLSSIASFGASIRALGSSPLEAEIAARNAACISGAMYISPYNDPEVVAGQGTIARELLEQLAGIDAIYVAVGGGGLVSGIGAYMKCKSPATEIIGCWPENSRAMYECLRAGNIIDVAEEATLSESTAGGVEPGSITFSLCQAVIDRTALVKEAEILSALRWAHQRGFTIEGAAAVALACFLREQLLYSGKTVVIVSCGGNLSPRVRKLLEAQGSAT